MPEDEIRQRLADLLGHAAPGTVLLLLSEVLDEQAEAARRGGDAGRQEQLTYASHAACVLGLGCYAILPQ